MKRIINSFSGMLSILKSPFLKRNVLWALVRKDLKDKYASSFLGILWAVIKPLVVVLIYDIFFTIVYQSRIPEGYGNTPYIIFLLLGFTPYQIFTEVIGRSSSLLQSNISMITKMVFPYELFSVASFATAFIGAVVNFCMVIIFMAAYGIAPELMNLVYLPVFIIPLILFTIGLSWIVSCIGVIIKDTDQVVAIILTLLLFLTPVFYSHQMVEMVQPSYPWLAFIFRANPLYPIIEGLRVVFIGKEMVLSMNILFYMFGISILTFLVGGMIFNTFKCEIADYL
ncbi:MAG: ABC transporter permease [Bacteroidetes bacterium]|nr:ABC transporter permease [Bacteroidota bacterium]